MPYRVLVELLLWHMLSLPLSCSLGSLTLTQTGPMGKGQIQVTWQSPEDWVNSESLLSPLF